jgi:hypothetical protein
MEVVALAELHEMNQVLLTVATTKRVVRVCQHHGLDGYGRISESSFQRRNHALAKYVVEAANIHGNRDDARVYV